MAKPKEKRIIVLTKDMTLADTLEKLIGDGDDRSDIIDEMASEAGIEASEVNKILDGKAECPSAEHLKGFADALGVDVGTLTEAAEADGCSYGDDADDDDKTKSVDTAETKEVETEELKQKYYGYGYRKVAKGSFEDICRKIDMKLDDYFAKNLENVGRYDWLEVNISATYGDHAIVEVYHDRECKTYKIDYSIESNDVVLGDMTEVEMMYQPVSSM